MQLNETNVFVGVDFSISSPAICIKKDNVLTFFNILKVTSETKKEKLGRDILKTFPNLITDQFYIKPDTTNYIERENNNLLEAHYITEKILEFISTNTNKDNTLIGLEGFSYNSFGNNSAELAGYQYVLRYKLLQNGFNFKVFSPKTIKMTAGKGNYDKKQVIDAFLNSTDPEFEEFKTFINTNIQYLYLNDKYFIKPLDDIIDSIWAMKTIEKLINGSEESKVKQIKVKKVKESK